MLVNSDWSSGGFGWCCGWLYRHQGANGLHHSIRVESEENQRRMHRNLNPKRGADTSPATSTFTVRFRINDRIIPLRRHRPKHQPALSLSLSRLFFSLLFLFLSLHTHTHTSCKNSISQFQYQQITIQRLSSFRFKYIGWNCLFSVNFTVVNFWLFDLIATFWFNLFTIKRIFYTDENKLSIFSLISWSLKV